MRPFEYYRITTVSQALTLLAKHQDKAALLAGGSDLLGRMKDRLEGPKLRPAQHLIDITGIKELNAITEQKSGLRIGATATLSEIAASPLVAGRWGLLSQAAGQVAVPQIRNVGTLGGNLCQKPRCWYFRGRLFKECLRKGGGNCYAPGGENQYHAIFPADNCSMVCPSDMATALAALNAKVEVATAKGKRWIPMEQFYARPEKNVLSETVLGPAEMVVAVEVSAPLRGSKGVFFKLKEREAFDFAIVSAAVMVTTENNVISDSRIVLGGIGPVPFRAKAAEAALKGKKIADAMAAAPKAVEGAQPLSKNVYKVKAAKGLLEEALLSVA
jgi:xanthine dehydrogenase YagS FAD-binding subunit